jgi:hypothetical protein
LLPESVNEGSGEPELMPLEDISRFMEQVLADISNLPKATRLPTISKMMDDVDFV